MEQHLDTDYLRALRKLYTSTQLLKDAAIEKMVCYWGLDAVERLRLNQYSYTALRSSVKVAERLGIEEANRLLGQVSLRRLRSSKRGRASVREVTAGDWQELAALALNEATSEALQIPNLTNDEQVRFGMTEPLSIFGHRIAAAFSAYGRRRLQESNTLVDVDNTDIADLCCDATQIAKRARTHQKYSCFQINI